MPSMRTACQDSLLRPFGQTRSLLLTAVVALSTACAGRSAGVDRLAAVDAPSRSPRAGASRADGVHASRLVVDNAHFHHVRVSVVRNGTPIPIGTVRSMERRELRLPPRLVPLAGGLAVRVASPVEGRVWTSQSLPVERGQTIHLEVGFHLLRSAVSVWH